METLVTGKNGCFVVDDQDDVDCDDDVDVVVDGDNEADNCY